MPEDAQISTMESQNIKEHILERLTAYAHLFELFKGHVPDSPKVGTKLYRDDDIDRIWGPRFTFWGVLLHDSDSEFQNLLGELNQLAEKHKLAYGEDRLRAQITNDPFSFLSELMACDMFCSKGIMPVIEPRPTLGSERSMDLSVDLDDRPISIEVIKPQVPEHMLRTGPGFAPPDFDLSKKLAREMGQHLDIVAEPTNPTIIMVNGLYSALDPFIVGNSIEQLNNLRESDFPNEPPDQAKLLKKIVQKNSGMRPLSWPHSRIRCRQILRRPLAESLGTIMHKIVKVD